MDKIAQKLNAQEMIRANSAADAAQIDKLQAQVEEYDACMKEMRKLNLKSMENEQKLQTLLEKGSSGLQSLTEQCMARLQGAEQKSSGDSNSEVQEILGEMRTALEKNMQKTEELFRQSDDYAHKESVKVYRNVQAVVVEELEKQTQALVAFGQAAAQREKRLFAIATVAMAAGIINIGLMIVHMLGIF